VEPVLLASTSPRRAALLRAAAVPFVQVDPGVDDAREAELMAEARAAGLTPERAVLRLATAKLLAALARRPAAGRVVAADTVVVHAGAVLGKPADAAEAGAVLRRLRGGRHEVWTGLAVLAAGRLRLEAVRSVVRCPDFAEAALEAYLATGLWAGKAGGYGAQDLEAAFLVASVEGSLSNVKGLPLARTTALLASAAG